ncbi:MAG TPA: helix-hairpin-helix domain-containing protein [Anaerolineales bacterium]|jgi:predicted flap endonuclease-1-like 5' DNA nuclease|nr:helix-hairpin-helix domain-containing protein [Anaerolineales bacterium]
MKAVKVFVLGFILGLLYKWIIDQVYKDIEIQMIATEDPLAMDYSKLLDTKEQLMAEVKPVRPKTKHEILDVLKGIGPASVKRLNQAGVHTFDDLARLTPEELRSILGNVLRRAGIMESQVIAEAEKFAQQKTEHY